MLAIVIMVCHGLVLKAQLDTVCTNSGQDKGLYVNAFFEPYEDGSPFSSSRADFNNSIIGNPTKENALLFYAAERHINYLVLYGTSAVFRSQSSTINRGYESLIANFIIRAHNLGIKIGLAFGTNMIESLEDGTFTGIEPIDQELTYPKQLIVEKLQNDTTFPAWQIWKNLINNTPNAQVSINKELYALASVKRIGDQVEEQLQTGIHFGDSIGDIPLTLVTEYEWWNVSEKIKDRYGGDNQLIYEHKRDTLFPRFEKLLLAMEAYKNGGMGNVINLERIDVYHNRCPNNPNVLMATENAAQKQSWVEEITTYADRILLVNYTKHKSDIGKGNGFDEEVQLFNTHSVKPNLELAPLFNAASETHFVNEIGQLVKDPGFGNLMADGTSNGISIPQIHQRFNTAYQTMLDSNKAGQNIHLKGYQWFTYSQMPHMLYAKDNNKSLKLHLGTGKLVKHLKHYYFTDDNQPKQLEVFNPKRFPFDSTAQSTNNNGLHYSWYVNNTTFTNEQLLDSSGATRLSIDSLGMYYVKTTDSLGCTTASVPVLAQIMNRNLYMRDFNTPNDNGSEPNLLGQDIWHSPDIWVNQSAEPNDDTIANPIENAENYIHIKVRNKGNTASQGSEKLYVYYAKASVSLNWPDAWHNNDVATPPSNTKYPVGDRVNLIPFYIPAIPAHDSANFAFYWHALNEGELDIEDSVDVTGETYSENRHYCLLARIERSEYYPFGMYKGESQDIRLNTRFNNSIAWRNVTIFDQNGNGPKGRTRNIGTLGWSAGHVNMGNFSADTTTAKLEFEKLFKNNATLHTDGRILVNLGADLFARWKAGGMKGTGISLAPFNLKKHPLFPVNPTNITNPINELLTTIEINSPKAWIENITINPNEHFEMLVGARVSSSVETEQTYEFVLRHYNKDSIGTYDLLGGETYILNYNPCPKPEINKVQLGNDATLIANVPDIDLATEYTWYKNGQEIENTVGNVLSTSESGHYKVASYFPALECANTSDVEIIRDQEGQEGQWSVFIQASKLNETTNTDVQFELYPNPAQHNLTITLQDSYEGNIHAEVLDVTGKVLFGISYNTNDVESNTLQLQTTDLPNGNYFMRIKTSNNSPLIKKFVMSR